MQQPASLTSEEVNKITSELTLASLQHLKTVGTGTFGRVVLVKHRESSIYFALKILRKSEIVRLKQVDHVLNERSILLMVDFPFIVRLYRTFRDDLHVYLLLEFVIGGELFSHLRRAGKFHPDVARFYAAEITLALEYMHSKNVIYRDLKPENLLIDKDGHIKITDFGFAKVVEDRTFTLCGTPEYLAPEIIQSKGHGKAADWWALGILIFELLAGFPPFYDTHPFGIYEQILEGKIIFPAHFDNDAKDLIRKLLNPDKARRLGSSRIGAEDIKTHAWFQSTNWVDTLARKQKGPIIPEIRHAGDARNFDDYPEESERPMTAADQQAMKLFADF